MGAAATVVDGQQSLAGLGLFQRRLARCGRAANEYELTAKTIMKSGGFDEIGIQYSLSKLHSHSHLYTSDERIDFPGRIFDIKKVFPYSKQEMKNNLENTKANITTRNFPDSVEEIRKKWKIKDGGLNYCFFTTDLNNDKIVLLCNKLN